MLLAVLEEEVVLAELEEDAVVDADVEAEEAEPLVEAAEVMVLPRVEGFPVPPVISNWTL